MNIFSNNSEINFHDLYELDGLKKIDVTFKEFLKNTDEELFQNFSNISHLSEKNESNCLIAVAKVLELFLIEIFNIQNESEELKKLHADLTVIYQVKRDFIQRVISRKHSIDDVSDRNFAKIDELEFAKKFVENKEDEELREYAIWALFSDKGQKAHENGTLFRLPQKIDFENLVNFKNVNLRDRDGFNLTDQGYDLSQAIAEANYCIFCHNQGKDSCSKGLFEKKLITINKEQRQQRGEPTGEPALVVPDLSGTERINKSQAEKVSISLANAENKQFKKDFFGQELSGCPLEEKISEMNLLKSQGFSLGSLAIAVVDNPMIAATGHRICNDCMKSCIYQKQDPVDIPQIESKVLKDVLHLPYGFEIYSLLTRWNPLNYKNPLPVENSGSKVLVAGLGPAGFSLAHYLLQSGHLVVGIEGLKIEPLDQEISGVDLDGNRQKFKPIKDINEIFEDLNDRPVYGFGGVAEYGITVRWDKNFLKVIRLLLERRENFRMFGGVRLGSAMDCKDALSELDFDHVALCLGAGWPNTLNIKNNFVKGVRSASDFLMALQLTGAMHESLITNLQVRLPVLVVGAGLTAIDTATESLAYYERQVENFSKRYHILCEKLGAEYVEKDWNEEEKEIASEFLNHAQKLKKVKENGGSVTKLLQELGGAKLVYRKNITQAPSYRQNHIEIQKALEEGIEIIDEATPVEIIKDNYNYISALKIEKDGKKQDIAAKSLFVAIGTSPNKAPAYEDKLKFSIENNSYEVIDLDGNKVEQKFSPKAKDIGYLAALDENKKAVSFFGDTHKAFAGSVVKAIASAKNGYSTINKSLEKLPKNKDYSGFLNKVNQEFSVKVKEVNILSDNVFELIVHAPLLAKKTKLGHIFRLHNYHALSPIKGKGEGKTILGMEGVALTTYKVDAKKGLIGVVVINTGGSSSVVKDLKPEENIIFMGPSGSPTHIAENQEVVFIAGGRGLFPLASLAAEHKKQGCKTTLFCGYKKASDILRLEELYKSCDQLIISIEEGSQKQKEPATVVPDLSGTEKINKIQAEKISISVANAKVLGSLQRGELPANLKLFKGNIVDAFVDHVQTKNKSNIDLIFTMGNEDMMHEISKVRHTKLKDKLKESHISITSLNNPMQCMLKGVCSQCLQKKTNPKTGKEIYFYSCISQDQFSDTIDFEFLKNRCTQNSLSEKLTKEWIKISA